MAYVVTYGSSARNHYILPYCKASYIHILYWFSHALSIDLLMLHLEVLKIVIRSSTPALLHPMSHDVPIRSAPSATGGSGANPSSSETSTSSQPPTFPGAPERDPWSEKPGSRAAKTGILEDELAREERELFGRKRSKQAQEDTSGVQNK